MDFLRNSLLKGCVYFKTTESQEGRSIVPKRVKSMNQCDDTE